MPAYLPDVLGSDSLPDEWSRRDDSADVQSQTGRKEASLYCTFVLRILTDIKRSWMHIRRIGLSWRHIHSSTSRLRSENASHACSVLRLDRALLLAADHCWQKATKRESMSRDMPSRSVAQSPLVVAPQNGQGGN
jgi:hypothetical protein